MKNVFICGLVLMLICTACLKQNETPAPPALPPAEEAAAPAPQEEPIPEPANTPAPEPAPIAEVPQPAEPEAIDYLSQKILPSTTAPGPEKYPLRWFYYSCNFQTNASVDKLIEVCKKARGIGYNGVLIIDYKFGSLVDRPKRYYTNLERFAAACKAIDLEIIPSVMTPSLLINDPMMVEGIPIKDQEFIVSNGQATIKNKNNLLKNSGFEEMKNNKEFSGWSWIDAPGTVSFQDTEVKHSGNASVRLENFRGGENTHGNARINAKLNLKPWTAYRVQVWVKTEDLNPAGGENPKMIALCPDGRNLIHRFIGIKKNQDWTRHVLTFNTLQHSEVRIYCGIWGGKSGKMWIDDFELYECGGVNLVRRDGCPLKITNTDSSITYTEGVDFLEWTDPESGRSPWPGSFDNYHEEPPIVLTAGSRMKEGETLKVSYYHTLTTLWGAPFPCYLNDDLFKYAKVQIEDMEKYFKPTKYFMAHDEIRVAGWCETCTPYGTCGDIMAEHIRRYIKMLKSVNPDAELFIWNDMFDPYHNAYDWADENSPFYKKANPYYLASTPFAGSWEGLDTSVVIANWYSKGAQKSFPFYEELGMREIIAGYYDSADVKNRLKVWMDLAKPRKGIVGIIYTTWTNNYSHMQQFWDAIEELSAD